MAGGSKVLRGATYVALALAGFAVVSSAVRAVTPWPSEYGQRAKYEYFAEHADEFDAIFVGSSVTAYGVVPTLFDEVMAQRGHPVRSFNLGVGGMTSLEADHLLRRVLELEPARLRWVFVEAENWDARIWVKRNAYAPRTVHWHTLEHTRIAIASLMRRPAPAPEKPEGFAWDALERLAPPLAERVARVRATLWPAWWRFQESWLHAALAMRKLSGAGQGKRIARSWLGLDRAEVRAEVPDLEPLRGYIDLDRMQSEEWDERRADFLAKQDRYRESVAAIDAQNATAASPASHFSLEGLQSQMAAIREAGAEPLYFTGPRVLASPLELALARDGTLPALFAFNQPGKYPELYDPENRYDQNHVKRRGAEGFTRLLAESFADHLDAQAERASR